MSTYSKLVIAPHADDEVLGCSSVLDEYTFVYFCGIDERFSYGSPDKRIPQDERISEVDAVAKIFGYEYAYGPFHVNKYQFFDVKESLESIVNTIKPEKVFIPCRGFNQDHNTVYEASMVALRPHDTNHFVKKVLAYESVHDVQWPPYGEDYTYFVPLDLDKKIMGYQAHKSQVRDYRGVKLIVSLASIRGASARLECAEAFQVLRWVE